MLREYRPILIILGIQLAILCAVPRDILWARMAGTDVTLAVRPYDPYDPLSGYYAVLQYAVERQRNLEGSKGLKYKEKVFLNLERDEPAWRAVSVSRTPADTDKDHVSILGVWRSGTVQFVDGRKLFIPEVQRGDVERALRVRDKDRLVDVRVSGRGRISVLKLRAGGRVFGD